MHREIIQTLEVADGLPETLRLATVKFAIASGEGELALRGLVYEGVHYDHGAKPGMVFNVQGPSTSYSSPYATCRAFPALKSGTRYFELTEVNA